jgi:hypothetical protein
LAVSLLFNALFAVSLSHRVTYDAYAHIFFADHYRQRWWSLWEPRWYLGFSVASYPPLTHQLIALLSWPLSAALSLFSPEPYPSAFRVLGEEAGFVVVLLSALALFPLAVHGLARVFVGPRAAEQAAWLAVFLPALSLSAWSFGQLPTIMATSVTLLALARGAAFLRFGGWPNLVQAVALAAVAGATHHGVFLLVPFAGLAIVLRVLTLTPRNPAHYASLFIRTALWTGLSTLAVAVVLWPFLWWSRGQSLQTPIDHASRHNFLTDWTAAGFFFWPMYGPLLLIAPLAVHFGLRSKRWPLLAAFGALFVLGLGGTTPFPAMLFGSGWEWLTYDRFAFWAGTLLLPLAGAVMVMWKRAAMTARALLARYSTPLFFAGLALSAGLAGSLARLLPAQPTPVDFAPIVQFLNTPEHRLYRYLTLGFGDQFAKLSALTYNGSPDGAYHTARSLPELRSSGLGALDTALWTPQGVWAVRPFLEHPERYGLRWVFAHHPDYYPVLIVTGWRVRWQMGGATVWERADVRPIIAPAPPENEWMSAWWGAASLAALGAAMLTLGFGRARPEAVE